MLPLSTPSLRLDADHRYWLEDRELLSVTAVLMEAGLIDQTWFTEEAADRGTYVHQACQLRDADDLGACDPAYAGYLEAYERFLREAVPAWVHIEHRVCDPTLGYAGTVDRAGHFKYEWAVLDIKTGPPAPWHGLQLAAYGRLLPRMGLRPKRYDLYLTATGTYRLEPQTTRTDESVFLSALQLTQFRRTHGYHRR
jgi:hypothetical protein